MKADAADGAEIQIPNSMLDANEPMVTNEAAVWMARNPPQSQMQAVAERQSRGVFDVQWQASEAVSGVDVTVMD